MSTLLDGWGCDHRSASSGAAALELVDRGFVPELVIADQHLDHGDLGTETLARLLDRLRRRIPAILATADITEPVLRETERLGAEFMAKPVKPAQLRALMAHLLAAAP
jgi:CheY-like chemotaxis protein